MSFILSLVLTLSALAVTPNYIVETSIFSDGKLIATRESALSSGGSDEYYHEKIGERLKLKLTLKEEKKGALKLSYQLDLSGVKSNPAIITLAGERAAISQKEEGKPEIKIEAMVRNLNDVSQVVPTFQKDPGEELASYSSDGDFLEELELSAD